MVEFVLSEPLDHGGTTRTTLTIRPVKTKDIRRIGKPVTFQVSQVDPSMLDFVEIPDKQAQYVAAITGLTMDAVDRLAVEDYSSLVEHVQGFFTELSLKVRAISPMKSEPQPES